MKLSLGLHCAVCRVTSERHITNSRCSCEVFSVREVNQDQDHETNQPQTQHRFLLHVCKRLPVTSMSMKKALGETQTLRTGRSNAEPKIFAPPQTPFTGAQDRQNLISWRSSCTYRPSLVKIDARNFELSW